MISKLTKQLLITSILFVPIMGAGVFLWFVEDTYRAVFPSNTFITQDEEIVSVTIGLVKYDIPKAYLYWKQDLKGGKLQDVRLWASLKDNMAAWPLSDAYKNNDKNSRVHIILRSGMVEPYRSEFPYDRIRRNLERGGKYRGIYKDIFLRYDEPETVITRGGIKERLLSRFLLIPKDKKLKYLKFIPYAWRLIELRMENNEIFDNLKKILNLNFPNKIRNLK